MAELTGHRVEATPVGKAWPYQCLCTPDCGVNHCRNVLARLTCHPRASTRWWKSPTLVLRSAGCRTAREADSTGREVALLRFPDLARTHGSKAEFFFLLCEHTFSAKRTATWFFMNGIIFNSILDRSLC